MDFTCYRIGILSAATLLVTGKVSHSVLVASLTQHRIKWSSWAASTLLMIVATWCSGSKLDLLERSSWSSFNCCLFRKLFALATLIELMLTRWILGKLLWSTLASLWCTADRHSSAVHPVLWTLMPGCGLSLRFLGAPLLFIRPQKRWTEFQKVVISFHQVSD